MIYVLLVPSDSPRKLVLRATTPYNLSVGWETPNFPNGVITFYTIYVRYNDVNESRIIIVNGNTTKFTLSHLQPYTLVNVKLSANTSAGEGPVSTARVTRTAQASKTSLLI